MLLIKTRQNSQNMAFVGLSTRKGVCAICKTDFPKGTHVYFDATKTPGNHLAHKECFDEILQTRGPRKTKGKVGIQSTERLDPPF